MTDLPVLAVQLSRNGEPCASATGADAGGHPAAGLAWLAAQLGARAETLEPGDLVITGGLTAAVPLEPGDEVVAVFTPHGEPALSVSVRAGVPSRHG